MGPMLAQWPLLSGSLLHSWTVATTLSLCKTLYTVYQWCHVNPNVHGTDNSGQTMSTSCLYILTVWNGRYNVSCPDWKWILTPSDVSKSSYVIKWKHFSVLLALCAGNSLVTGEFRIQRSVTRSFDDVFFDLRVYKRLSKQSWGWRFETPASSLWRHCNVKWKQNKKSSTLQNLKIVTHRQHSQRRPISTATPSS